MAYSTLPTSFRFDALRKYSLRIIGLVLFGSSLALAQVVTPTDTIAPPVPGVGHDYINMLNETVNPENGGVSLRIQVPVPPGRKLTVPFSFNYDSTETLFFLGDWHVGFGLMASSNMEPFASGAWSYGLPRLNNFTQTITVPGPTGGASPDGSTLCGVTSNYTFVDIDGSSHQLGLSHIFNNFPGYFGNQNWECGNSQFAEYDSSPTDPMYQASFTALIPDSQHNGSEQPNDGQPKVAGPDGTLYTFPELSCGFSANPYPCSRLPASIEDKDGNILTIPNTGQSSNNPSFSVVDTAGRTVLSGNNFGLTGSTVAVSGLAQPYTLTWATQNYSGYTVNSQSNAPQGTLFCAPSGPVGTGAWTQTVVTAIALPNGQSYTFDYDQTYGTIKKITYPSGGYIRYEYGLNLLSTSVTFNGRPSGFGPPMTIAANACNVYLDTVAVAHRYVSYDGVNEVMQQDYSYPPTNWNGNVNSWATKQTIVTTHDLVRGTAYTTTYNYTSVPITSPPNGSGVDAQAAVEQSIVYNDTSGALLQTVTKGWNDQYTMACEVDTLGPSGPSSAVFNTYGTGDVLTDKKEYDYGLVAPSSCFNGATAPSGVAVTRETVTTYQSFGATTYSAPSLLNAPCRVTISGGSVTAETDYLYDNGTSVCGAAGAPSVTGVGNLPTGSRDPQFGSGGSIARGDLTRIDRLNTGGATSTTKMSYYETGQVYQVTDPCGNATCADMAPTNHVTTYDYTDSPAVGSSAINSSAYVTKVTRPNTGVAHIENYKYNYSSGKLSEVDDENSQPTTYSYTDPFLRLTDVYGPPAPEDYGAQAHTHYAYVDGTNPSMTVTNPIGVTAKTFYDGLGHVIKTQSNSDPTDTYLVDIKYDGEGRVYSASNSYLSTADPTYGITSYTYDALGRKLLQCQPDNGNNDPCVAGSSYQQWTYNGNVTSFRDEVGNTWLHTSDALGRLTDVTEPGSLKTHYDYSVLGDLRCVDQWETGPVGTPCTSSRARGFKYDSLSHLIQSFNPETGWICYGSTGGSAPNGTNCTSGYDANGNLQYKTDARNIRITYQYDALNRLTQKSYSTGDATAQYFYDVLQQPSMPACGTSWVSQCNTVGRLSYEQTVDPVTGAVQTLDGFSYDPEGRFWAKFQATSPYCNPCFSTLYNYDLAGNTVQYRRGTVGSGLPSYPFYGDNVFTYDSAGRIQSVAESMDPNDWGPTETLLFTANQYGPMGLTSATLGNGMTLSLGYNNRSWKNSIGYALSTGGIAYNLGLTYFHNGNVQNANDSSINGNWSYTYDSLNRLSTASQAGQALQYCYDSFGNRTCQTVTAGSGPQPTYTFSNNRNQMDPSAGVAYDPLGGGNVTWDGSHSYTYDAEGRLSTVDGNIKYIYNAEGQRTAVLSGSSVVRQYLYDNVGRPATVLDGNGNLIRVELWAGTMHFGDYVPGGTHNYIISDHLGSLRAVYDNAQTQVQTCQSLPFGDGQSCTGTDVDPLHFTGKERDTESGLDYFGARYNSSTMGRFMSPDWAAKAEPVPYSKLDNPQSLNLYAYVFNNPVTDVDADGHEALWQHGSTGQEDCSNGVHTACVMTQQLGQPQDKQNDGTKNLKKPTRGGRVKAAPKGQPPIPLPPGPDGQPNEWVPVPGTADKPYGPRYKPKFDVPGGQNGAQPNTWWDPEDGWWSHEPGDGGPRGHYDPWGNKVSMVKVAEVTATVWITRVVVGAIVAAGAAEVATGP
jgi:RHS repeat-associated protein